MAILTPPTTLILCSVCILILLVDAQIDVVLEALGIPTPARMLIATKRMKLRHAIGLKGTRPPN